ncbi:MAG: alpha/beta fold hydrolase [Candidatus Saccharibacteria bacterium]|nr:MAG: alpha/beta fold hydrolase [Candidatus Saccharibacteria bacterium]
MWDELVHRWLKIPYTLNVRVDQRVKKPRATILFIHGIGNSGEAWNDVVSRLPSDLRVITVDLLGFGSSHRPPWAVYNARLQARSVIATFLKLRVHGPVIIVGHSLGSLIAVEIAKKYPLLVRSLILCSPPFYKVDETKRILLPSSDKILRDIYRTARRYPEQFVQISMLAVKLGLVNASFNLSKDNADTYMNALESSIINQTSLQDATGLSVPTKIIYGKLDPVVVARNLKYLAKANSNITVSSVIASHEIRGAFIPAITHALEEEVKKPRHTIKDML